MILQIVGSMLPLLMERVGERRIKAAVCLVLIRLTLPSPAGEGIF
jgi:hypothetical protein